MNEDAFVTQVALKAGLTNSEASSLVSALVLILSEKLKEKPDFTLEGLGKFSLDDNKVIFEPDQSLIC